jgi:competence protein ComEC
MSQKKKVTISIFSFLKRNLINLVSIFLISLLFVLDGTTPDRLVFIDVGQGDSVLIQLDGKNIVIDGGPDDTVIFKLSNYIKPWDHTIDILVLTHPHGDHIEGVNDILRRFTVKQLLIHPVCYGRADWKELINRVNIIKVSAGDTFLVDGWRFTVLWPLVKDSAQEETCVKQFNGNVNNDSIILLMESILSDKKVLFTGDAEIEVEEELIRGGYKERVRNLSALKAGHHCSNTSTSWNFLFHTDPALVVCSVGMSNKFGHPGKETIERLHNQDVGFLRTDLEGDIVVKL